LNKTNSELKKSGSFIEADIHLGKVLYGYRILEPLGEGAYARVYKAVYMGTGTPVAIKGKFFLVVMSFNISVQKVSHLGISKTFDHAGNHSTFKNQSPQHCNFRRLFFHVHTYLYRHGAY
jgi:hypothetical protein